MFSKSEVVEIGQNISKNDKKKLASKYCQALHTMRASNLSSFNLPNGRVLYSNVCDNDKALAEKLGVVKNMDSLSIADGGINPQNLSLLSRISNFTYTYKSSFFRNRFGTQTPFTIDDIVPLGDLSDKVKNSIFYQNDYNNNFSNMWDKFYFKLERENSFISTKEDYEGILAGDMSHLTPPNNSVNTTDNTTFGYINNFPVMFTYSLNILENAQQEALLNYSINQKKEEDILKQGEKASRFMTIHTLFGSAKYRVPGLFNINEIVNLNNNDVNALYFRAKGDGVSSLKNSSLTQIYQNLMTNKNMFNNFKAKILSLINGCVPEGFDGTASYNNLWSSNFGMIEPILVIPDSDYASLSARLTLGYVGGDGGTLESMMKILTNELGLYDIVPLGALDVNKAQKDNFGEFTLTNTTDNCNWYFLIDRKKISRYITTPLGAIKYKSVDEFGTRENHLLVGSVTGVVAWEKIVGFKWEVQQ